MVIHAFLFLSANIVKNEQHQTAAKTLDSTRTSLERPTQNPKISPSQQICERLSESQIDQSQPILFDPRFPGPSRIPCYKQKSDIPPVEASQSQSMIGVENFPPHLGFAPSGTSLTSQNRKRALPDERQARGSKNL